MIDAGQIQIRVSISQQLGDLLKSKAERLGVPITQLVKHLIIDEVKDEQYPVFKASAVTEKAAMEAMDHIDEAVDIDNVNEFFKNL
ncbi:MAG TPA: hypothetical protein VMR77_01155 [Patescibacteria group bacterium]|jgi:hypothetical protein|nr:hypothetical protein [Patescibacteria group bacterium]